MNLPRPPAPGRSSRPILNGSATPAIRCAIFRTRGPATARRRAMPPARPAPAPRTTAATPCVRWRSRPTFSPPRSATCRPRWWWPATRWPFFATMVERGHFTDEPAARAGPLPATRCQGRSPWLSWTGFWTRRGSTRGYQLMSVWVADRDRWVCAAANGHREFRLEA